MLKEACQLVRLFLMEQGIERVKLICHRDVEYSKNKKVKKGQTYELHFQKCGTIMKLIKRSKMVKLDIDLSDKGVGRTYANENEQ